MKIEAIAASATAVQTTSTVRAERVSHDNDDVYAKAGKLPMGRRYMSDGASRLTWRIDVEMGEQGHAPFNHCHGSGDDDRAPPQRRGPVTLLRIGSFQRHSLVFSLVMSPESQHLVIDNESIRTVQANFPALKPGQQTAKCLCIAPSAFPIDEFAGLPIIGFPDPNFVALAAQEMPHLIQFDHHSFARLRLATRLVNIVTDPTQNGLCGRPEETGNGSQQQSMTIQTNRGTLDGLRCVGTVRLGELIAAASTPPPLLAQDMTGFHNATATASRTRRMLLHC